MFQYRDARVFLCNVGEVYIFEFGCYISALGHVRVLILSSYVLLACINKTDNICDSWVDLVRGMSSSVLGIEAIYLRFETCWEVKIGHASSSLRHKHKLSLLSRLSDFVTYISHFFL